MSTRLLPLPTPSGPSSTARFVAMGRAVGWQRLHDPLAHRFLSPLERAAVRGIRRATSLPLGGPLAGVATAGLHIHASLRMAAVDAAVTDAVGEGCRQVVVVGAGYDTRAWRLTSLRDTRVVELDLRAIQQRKRRAMAGVTPVADVTFVPVDLSRQPIAEALVDADVRADEPIAFVWEAVAPYLPDRAVRATAADLATLAPAGSRLIMTFAHPMPGRGVVGAALDAGSRLLFAAMGEPLRSTYDDWDVLALLDDAGWLDPVISVPAQWAREAGRSLTVTPFAVERMVRARR